ncbi:MAG: DUF5047 domain-containing protein [Phycicoccus sp.]
MRPLSDLARSILAGASHQMTCRVASMGFLGRQDAWPSASAAFTREVIAGTVTESLDATIRSRVDLTLRGDWPADVGAYAGSAESGPQGPNLDGWNLSPLGSEIHVGMLLRMPDGSDEQLGIGYYRVDSVEEQRPGVLRVSGSDRSAHIIDQPRPVPVSYAAGATLDAVLQAVIDSSTAVQPGIGVTIPDVDIPTPFVYDIPADASTVLGGIAHVDRDRWAAVQTIVASRGRAAWVDHRGRLRIGPPPGTTVSPTPVWTIRGGPGGTLSALRRAVTRRGVLNRMIVTGDQFAGGTQVIGVAVDNDPLSVSRVQGLMGVQTEWAHLPVITSNAAATTAAETIGKQRAGAWLDVEVDIVPCPTLEPGDAVLLQAGDGTPDRVCVVRESRIPLAGGVQSLRLKAAL